MNQNISWRHLLLFFQFLIEIPFRLLRDQWKRSKLSTTGAKIAASSIIRITGECEIKLSPGVAIGHGTILVADSQSKSGSGRIVIGCDSAINEFCNIRASGSEIIIGQKCLIAQFVSIISSNHGLETDRPMIDQNWNLEKSGVFIGDDVWIGTGAIILPGIKIGSGAVIGAGSVVNRNIPAMEIWVGVPARCVSIRV